MNCKKRSGTKIFSVSLDVTKRHYNVFTKAKGFVKDNSSVLYSFDDINCPVALKLMILRRNVSIMKTNLGLVPTSAIILIALQSNFIENTLQHGCALVNFEQISRTTFPKNTSGGLLPNKFKHKSLQYSY